MSFNDPQPTIYKRYIGYNKKLECEYFEVIETIDGRYFISHSNRIFKITPEEALKYIKDAI